LIRIKKGGKIFLKSSERKVIALEIISEELEYILLRYGFPLSYYVNSHFIFRFVEGRDSFWRNHFRLTDESDTQWKQALNDCKVKVTFALSPQAKGKI